MEYKNIIFDVKDGIGYVTMNRPKALNALNTEVLTELDDVFRAIDKNDDVQVVIVTGEGRSFIAGADIAQMSDLNGTEGRDMTIQGQLVME
ncbi:MAG: enoyl-CoA hydratase-related protein, partial [Anaerovoracaceae bacterium]